MFGSHIKNNDNGMAENICRSIVATFGIAHYIVVTTLTFSYLLIHSRRLQHGQRSIATPNEMLLIDIGFP
jgi:hypothetical protein